MMTKRSRYLIIGGTYKSGTTSLYTYLNQSNQVYGSKIKETGFFVPARYSEPCGSEDDYLSRYFAGADEKDILMEASPGYLYGGKRVAQKIEDTLGRNNSKMVFILREPVSRFISFYKMLKNENIVTIDNQVSKENWSLKEYFERCKNYNRPSEVSDQNTDYLLSGLSDGCYSKYLEEWYDVFRDDEIKILFFDDIVQQPKAICQELARWLDVDASIFDQMEFRNVNQFRSHKSKSLRKIANYFNHRLEFIWRKNERLKARMVRIYDKLNKKKSEESYDAELLKAIDAYYESERKNLSSFLENKGYKNRPEWLGK